MARLRSELARLPARPCDDDLVHLLLLAGDLECALHDAGSPPAALEAASRLTDLLAQAALARESHCPLDPRQPALTASQTLGQITPSGMVSVSVPEGFAWYALHPLDFADVVGRLELAAPEIFVIGIRTIGTTLSAVVAAELVRMGIRAQRATVRPTGHPYYRSCEFDPRQRQSIARAVSSHSAFLICDEGPGRSGSSFLSVAEALERQGVPRERISILCSHEVDISALCAPDAARRWMRYRSVAIGMTRRLPPDTGDFLGGGDWRGKLLAPGDPWPALWPLAERVQYLSHDRQKLLMFEGHGPWGGPVRSRNQALSDGGFGLPYLGHQLGFGVFSLPPGRLARRDDLSPELLTRMAQYCAWRARHFPADNTSSDGLPDATRANFELEFGSALDDFALAVERPVICDARMAPHYWFNPPGGRWLKLDAAVHGDDHFFPGPCDIAWDLAGTVVEWELSGSAREFLLSAYRRLSGDDASERLASWEFAYALFRLAWSKMAAVSLPEGDERQRLLHDYLRYRRIAEALQPAAATFSAGARL
ncbi:MAG TPA: hypothetical protein VL240_04715 [Candidatus Binatia bacterium]|nr:hypothetical protein [Candidatus Binatia bacterium]